MINIFGCDILMNRLMGEEYLFNPGIIEIFPHI